MVSNWQNRWAARGAAFLLWALLAASVAYWVLKLIRPEGVVAAPAARAAPPADPAAVARLLGSSPGAAGVPAAPAVRLASRFVLVGVAAGQSRGGAALIAIDGKPARPFRVGSAVEEGIFLQAVEARRAVLAASAGGPALLTLELPPRK